jgi:hypothetical protein
MVDFHKGKERGEIGPCKEMLDSKVGERADSL